MKKLRLHPYLCKQNVPKYQSTKVLPGDYPLLPRSGIQAFRILSRVLALCRRPFLLHALVLCLVPCASSFCPSILCHLVGASHRQGTRGHVFGDTRSGTDVSSIFNRDWCYKRGIAPHE